MTSTNHGRLLIDAANDRYYLVPLEYELKSGETLLIRPGGDQLTIDVSGLGDFEIGAARLRSMMQLEIDSALDEAIAEITTAYRRFARPSVSFSRRSSFGGRGRGSDPRTGDLLVIVRQLSAAIATGDRDQLRTSNSQLHTFGVDLGDILDELPARIDAIGRLDPQSAGRTAELCTDGLAQMLGADGGTGSLKLDELLSRFEREIGALIGLEPNSAAQRKAEYRQSANSAIADSLCAAGIEPLASAGSVSDSSHSS